MSGQDLDLRRSAHLIRRHWLLVSAIAVLGVVAGAGYNVYKPPMRTANTEVVVPYAPGFPTGSTAYTATQVVIAHSDPVLADALPDVGAPMSLATLRDRVQVSALTSNVISISGQGRTASQAEAIANAVTNSYLSYIDSAGSPFGKVHARILGKATATTGTPKYLRAVETMGTGLLAGLLVGVIIGVAVGRGDRRLRERDQIADSIGVPVLASVSAEHPRSAAGWAKLLEHYEPTPMDAWHLRKALHQLGLLGTTSADPGATNGSAARSPASLAVLSLSSDPQGLAIGPQLAAFAASLGLRTALIVSSQQGENAMATLYAACAAAPPVRSGNLLVGVSDHDDLSQLTRAALTVVIGVVNGENPKVANTVRAATTVLAVSAGSATGEQLARVATSAAVAGRDIAWILVADPDPADQTTGRMPQVGRPADGRIPRRVVTVPTENRR
jgi:capsular polysaccharide biosynthesis protein